MACATFSTLPDFLKLPLKETGGVCQSLDGLCTVVPRAPLLSQLQKGQGPGKGTWNIPCCGVTGRRAPQLCSGLTVGEDPWVWAADQRRGTGRGGRRWHCRGLPAPPPGARKSGRLGFCLHTGASDCRPFTTCRRGLMSPPAQPGLTDLHDHLAWVARGQPQAQPQPAQGLPSTDSGGVRGLAWFGLQPGQDGSGPALRGSRGGGRGKGATHASVPLRAAASVHLSPSAQHAGSPAHSMFVHRVNEGDRQGRGRGRMKFLLPLSLLSARGGWHHFKSCRPQPCAQLWTPPIWLGKRWLSPCCVDTAVASGRPSVEVSTQWGPCGHPSGGQRPQCLCSPFSGTGVEEVDTSSSCPPLDRRHPHPKVCVQGAEEDTRG